ncbi:MAG: hypothetical protein PVG14_07555 [Anaerolineales bacterium]
MNTPPTVYLGPPEALEVLGVESTTISATNPWGLGPSVYTLTVQNPNGGTGSLPNAFTVTQGFGVSAGKGLDFEHDSQNTHAFGFY